MAFNVGSIVARLGFDLTGWVKGKRQVSADVRALGMDVTRLGAVITGFAGVAVKEIGSFDKALRESLAVSDVTTQQFDDMSNMAEKMSKDLNKVATETVRGFYFLGSAGLKATEQMQSFASVNNMARAMTVEVGQAAEGLVDIMRGFNITFDESNRVADTLVKTVITSNQVFSDLDKAMSYVSSTANMSNNSLSDVAAMLGVMANAGIKGSYAGVALRRSFTNLMSPTREMIDLIHALEIQLYDASTGEMRPFIDLMGNINFQLRNASERYKNMVFEILFGRRAIAGQIKIFEYGKEQLQQYSQSLAEADGTMKAVVEKQMAAFLHQLGRVYRGVQDLAREIGRGLVPTIRAFADQAIPVIDAVKSWVKENSELAMTIIKTTTAIGGLALVVGPLMILLPTMIKSIGLLTAGFSGLIAPVVVAVAGFYALQVAWGNAFKAMRLTANDFTGKFAVLLDDLGIVWENKIFLMKAVWTDLLNSMWTGFAKIGTIFSIGWLILKNNWSGFTSQEMEELSTMIDFLKTGKLEFPTTSFMEGSKSLIGGMADLAISDFDNILGKLKEVSPELANFLSMLSAVVTGSPEPTLPSPGAEPAYAQAGSIGGEDISNIWASHWRQSTKTVMDDFTQVYKMFENVQRDIIDGFDSSFNKLMQHGSSFADFMDNMFDSILQSFISFLAEMAAKNMFYQIFGNGYVSDAMKSGGGFDASGIYRALASSPTPDAVTGAASKIIINNNSGIPLTARKSANPNEFVIDALIDGINTNSNLRQTLRDL